MKDRKPTPQVLHPQGQSRIKDTAKILGVHHQTLRRWWHEGKFMKPIEINGMLFFKNAEILQWLDEQHSKANNGEG